MLSYVVLCPPKYDVVFSYTGDLGLQQKVNYSVENTSLEDVLAAFELETEEEKAQARGLILNQIREALGSGVLFYAA